MIFSWIPADVHAGAHGPVVIRNKGSHLYFQSTFARASKRNFAKGTRLYSTEPKKLPRYGEIAVERYIADSDVVNKDLRGVQPWCLTTPLVRNLDLALRYLPKELRAPLYRVETRESDFIEGLEVGTVLHYKSYVSTSRNPEFFEVAHKYPFGTNHNVQYIIEKHENGRFISHLSPGRDPNGPKEVQEVLFPRDTLFEVMAVSHRGEKVVVMLQEVRDPARQSANPSTNQPAEHLDVAVVQDSDFARMDEDIF